MRRIVAIRDETDTQNVKRREDKNRTISRSVELDGMEVARSALDSQGRTIWIANAHRGDGERFVMSSDEQLTAFGRIGSSDFSASLKMNHRWPQFEALSVNNEAKIRSTGITVLWVRQIIRCINASGQTINLATSPFIRALWDVARMLITGSE